MPQDDISSLDYEVISELTWENGQLVMHGLGGPRVANNINTTPSSPPGTWEKPGSGGTLESIVNQATTCRPLHPPNNFLSCFQQQRATVPMDALVPRPNKNYINFGSHEQEQSTAHVLEGCSARVGSCSAANGAGGGESHNNITLDTREREFGGSEFTSPANIIFGQECTTKTSADDRDSISHHTRSQASDVFKADDEEVQVGNKRRKGKSSVCTKSKRCRDSEIHNKSERNRRERINERMRILQKMVPRSSKTDKASMLDEVIEYMKQLQAQVSMLTMALNLRPSMVLPMHPFSMQQQLQMPMMGMGVMDDVVNRPAATENCPRPPPIMPRPPLLACQSQPILTMDAYNTLAAMYQQSQHQLQQQQQQQHKPSSKN